MKIPGKKILCGILLGGGLLLFIVLGWDLFTFENLHRHRGSLLGFVHRYYFLSVVAFVAAYVSTAFIVPGALVLTVAGGFLYGIPLGPLYVLTGATLGAVLAFLAARYLFGHWIQQRYEKPLQTFNREIAAYGPNYLFTMRILPVFPFFLVNYLAGVTRIPLRTYVLTSVLAELPGAFVFAYAGRQLRDIHSAADLLSPPLYLAFALLAVVALAPVFLARRKIRRG